MGGDPGLSPNSGLGLIWSPGPGLVTVPDLGPISIMIPSQNPSSSHGQLLIFVPIFDHRVRVLVHFWVWDIV